RDKLVTGVQTCALPIFSSAPEAPVLAGAASRNQTENSTVAGATAARAHRESPRLRQQKGGKRSEEHTSELQSLAYLVCRLLLEKKKKNKKRTSKSINKENDK